MSRKRDNALRLGILPEGEQIALTEIQLKEWLKCAKDCQYFIETYIKIRPVDGGNLIPFKLRRISNRTAKILYRS